MIRNIRKNFGAYDLRKKSRFITRDKRIYNFTTARTAGIVFICQNEEEFMAVKEFKNFLGSKSIATDVIGYVNDKIVPDHYLLRTGFNFFCHKDLTWYYKPDKAFVEDFSGKTYDILFDLSLQNLFPVEYILKISPAAYKIGRFHKSNPYDLMIDIKDKKTVPFLIDQIKHYLAIIHPKT